MTSLSAASTTRFAALLILLPLLATACDSAAGGTASTALVRDSAGVQIVENTGSAWEDGAGWRLTTEPLLQIGMAEGSAAYLLDRVTGARRLPDGRVVIANAGSGELRYYDAEGLHLHSVGGEGEGPGEYRNLDVLSAYRGDSLFVFDPSARRASILSQEGEFGRTLTFAAVGEGGTPRPMGTFGDGSVLGRLTVLVGPDEIKTGMQSSDAMYGRLSASDGTLVDSIAVVPGEERHLLAESNMLMITSPLIGPEPHVTVGEDRLFVGHGGIFDLREYASDGTLRRLIRRSEAPVALTADELDRLQQASLAEVGNEDARRRLAGIYAVMPRPEVRPAFAGLKADDAGNLWVRESRLPWESNLWTIFDVDGVQLGTVELPADFRPMHIGEDFVLGVVSDELDVQRVQMYGIEKDS